MAKFRQGNLVLKDNELIKFPYTDIYEDSTTGELIVTSSVIVGEFLSTVGPTDNYPLVTIGGTAHDSTFLSFDSYFDGLNWKSSDAGSNFLIKKSSDVLSVYYKTGVSQDDVISWKSHTTWMADGRFIVYSKLGIGTETIPHGGVGIAQVAIEGDGTQAGAASIQLTTPTDNYPVFQIYGYDHNAIILAFDCYSYPAYTFGFTKSSSASGSFYFSKDTLGLSLWADKKPVGNTLYPYESINFDCFGRITIASPPRHYDTADDGQYNHTSLTVYQRGTLGRDEGHNCKALSLFEDIEIPLGMNSSSACGLHVFNRCTGEGYMDQANAAIFMYGAATDTHFFGIHGVTIWPYISTLHSVAWSWIDLFIKGVGTWPYPVPASSLGSQHYAIYQEDAVAWNAFWGKVGVRTSSPVCPMEVGDNATSASMLVKITQDDANVYGLIIGNDTYSATDTNGLLFKVADTGAPTISWTAGVLTLSGGDVTIGSNANVNYSIKFDSSQSDGTITYQSAASDGYFYFNTPGLKLLAFGSFNTTGDTYFYASRSAVNYGVVKWDAVQDNVGNTDLWINTGFANDKGVSIGYDSSLYPARTVATLDVRRIVNSTSSYGILYLQNDCDANPTIPYPVLRTDRYIEGHWMASLSISIAQWEDTGIAARSDIRFGLTHGNATYPDANILSLRSDGLVTIGDGAAGTDYILKFDGETNDGTITWMEDEAQFKFSNVLRTATSLYRRYYHIALSSANPGASGATWIDPGANSTGGWRIDAASEVLHGSTDVHSDWDGATDLTVEIRFYVNVNNTGGGAGDTVDLKAVFYYKGVGDTVTKTQTVEVATVVGASAQYKAFEADFTINWDEVSNVVEAGDVIGMLLNLETDTSEVDDIVVTGISFSYPTTHLGIEAGDT